MKDKLSLKKTQKISTYIFIIHMIGTMALLLKIITYNIYNVLALVWWATVQKGHKESDMTE